MTYILIYIVLYTYLPGFLPGHTGIPVYRMKYLDDEVMIIIYYNNIMHRDYYDPFHASNAYYSCVEAVK